MTVIIPAHNEARVIDKTLRTMLTGLENVAAQILVVCNGCTDDTADVARVIDDRRVEVLEALEASKAAALNVGDRVARWWPRVYMDADVRLGGNDLVRLARGMHERNAPSASPRARTLTAHSTWPVRAFYRVWTRTPRFLDGMIGCGVYALSQRGRARFDCFPNAIADDGFVRAMFAEGDRITVDDAVVEVMAPGNLGDLIRAKTRSRLGGYQLRRMCPHLADRLTHEQSFRQLAWRWVRSPQLWPAVVVYVAVNLICRFRAKRQLRHLGEYEWERDESSRRILESVDGGYK